MASPVWRILPLGLVLCVPAALGAQEYKPEDPVPPGAQGRVLPISGEVRRIVGLSSQVAGRVDPLAAALKDLGAKTTDTEIRIEMSADVLFDFDKADIRKEAEPALEKAATVLAAYPRSQVAIEGHTDAKGSDAYNQPLSERRAAAIKRWFSAKENLKNMSFVVRGFGATKPVASNTKPDGADDPEGRQKNRRVEIVIKKT